MSIEGSINVSALFHDKDGTTAMKVVSLRSSDEYTTGKVAIISGTAGTAQTTIELANVYKNAASEPVEVGQPERVLFSWTGSGIRHLELVDVDDFVYRLSSRNRNVSATTAEYITLARLTASSQNTGTYTIVLYGT